VDAVGLFGDEQVSRASRYHRPLYAAAIAQLILGLLLLACLVIAVTVWDEITKLFGL
jgi:hypothetical protein